MDDVEKLVRALRDFELPNLPAGDAAAESGKPDAAVQREMIVAAIRAIASDGTPKSAVVPAPVPPAAPVDAAALKDQFYKAFQSEMLAVVERDLTALKRTNPVHFEAGPFIVSDSVFYEAAVKAGLNVKTERVDVAAFTAWYAENDYRVRFPDYVKTYPSEDYLKKKALEHWLTLKYSPAPDGKAIDVGGSTSPFARLIRSDKTRCYHLDLPLPHLGNMPGVHGDMIGASADDIPLEDNTIDAIYSHNAVEHFEGPAFFGFFREAARVLKPGGVLCVAPLFVGAKTFAYSSMNAWYKSKRTPTMPRGLDIVIREDIRQPYSFHVSAASVKSEIVDKVDLDVSIIYFENFREAVMGFPFMFVGVKRQPKAVEPAV